MRLWHYKLIPYLPRSQLVAQWRELGSIFKKSDKHILINYIYSYPKEYLKTYADSVIAEMNQRGYKIKSFENYNSYFSDNTIACDANFAEHDDNYLTICYWNLYEKYIRGQLDFAFDVFDKLDKFYKNSIET